MFRYFLVLFGILILSGCSSFFGIDGAFRDRGSDYLKATEMPAVVVPDDLDSRSVGQLYPVPSAGRVVEYQLGNEFSTPRPAQISVNRSSGEVRVQRLGDDQWILIATAPGEAWPRVRAFLTANQIPTASANADEGLIETDWVKFDAQDEYFHQFQFKLEQGVQLYTTEIVVLHRQATEGELGNPSNWDAEGQAESMRVRLAEHLAADPASGTASLLGQEIGAEGKVSLIAPPAADPYLQMNLSFERAWASLEYSLQTIKFNIDSQSESEGVFEVSYVPPPPERNWLQDVLFNPVRPNPVPYRVLVEQRGGSIEVRISKPDGSTLSQRQAFEILSQIRTNLT